MPWSLSPDPRILSNKFHTDDHRQQREPERFSAAISLAIEICAFVAEAFGTHDDGETAESDEDFARES